MARGMDNWDIIIVKVADVWGYELIHKFTNEESFEEYKRNPYIKEIEILDYRKGITHKEFTELWFNN